MGTRFMRELHQLARLYGVQFVYYDMAHRRQQASVDALLAVLSALGARVMTLQDVPSALREYQQDLWQRRLEPVVIAWDGGPLEIEVRLPSPIAEASLAGHLILETGEQQSWQWNMANLPVVNTAEVEGRQFVVKRLPLSRKIPWGYHRLILEMPGNPVEALIIASPLKAYLPPGKNRIWGVFLPLYALHTQKSWGGGDFSDLEALIDWMAGMGGGVMATLPLLPTFLDEQFAPSPYAPVSRLLWNEFYLNVTKIPELGKCPSAQAILASSSFQDEIRALRSLPLVDYRRQMALKRQVLEELCRCCFAEASHRLEALLHFAQAHPVIEDYARFRATCERQRVGWRSWSQPLREGILKEGDYNEEAKRYHLYVQWLAQQQLQALRGKARQNNQRLYLDLPLGVHPDGYDIWRNQDLFAHEVSVGAPPDAFFSRGQDWGFQPLQPERLRQQRYSYYIAYLQHHLQQADILRIDHVMSLHRLFWIPRGMKPSQGVYVHYPAEEFYAILTLESHRNNTIIVGEDLGTVPGYVRSAMARHGLLGMYVAQFELTGNSLEALRTVPANTMASINTHDTPPFRRFWQGMDIQDRQDMGLLDEIGAQQELRHRQTLKQALISFLQNKGYIKSSTPDELEVLRAILSFLGTSSTPMVVVNLEDLWLEGEPQNVPGTRDERPNWRRKARYPLEVFSQMPEVVEILQELNRLRRQGG